MNKAGSSRCPRSQAMTECCSVQWSRLSTSRASCVNECINELPKKLMMHLNLWKGQLHMNKHTAHRRANLRRCSAKGMVLNALHELKAQLAARWEMMCCSDCAFAVRHSLFC